MFRKGLHYARWAALAVTVPLLASCGSGSAGSGSGELVVWHELTDSGNAAMEEVIGDFNASTTGPPARARQIPDDQLDTMVKTTMFGPNPPDVLQYEGYRRTADYASTGRLLDLTDWWNKHKSSFAFADSRPVKDACEYQGRMYCIPWDLYTSNQLYYNVDLLRRYGIAPPKTFSDVAAITRQLRGTGIVPISLYSSEGWEAGQWWALLTIQRCGVATIKAAVAQRNAKWNDPCFRQSAEDLAALNGAGAFPHDVPDLDYSGMMGLFLSGKAAFMNTGTWLEQTMAENPPRIEVGRVAFPQLVPAKPADQLLGGVHDVIGIPTLGDNHEQSLEFLDTLATVKSGQVFAKASVMNMVQGASDALPPELQQIWQTVVAALGPDGSHDNFVTYLENLLPSSVGQGPLLGGATAVAAGQMSPSDFVNRLQSAAAAAS